MPGYKILNEEWRLSVNRTEKAELIETLQATFNASTTIVVTHQVGLTVAESGELRLKMREAGAGFKVTKNRIAKLALKDTRYEDLGQPVYRTNSRLVRPQDPVAAAKTLVELCQDEYPKLTIIGGSIDGKTPRQSLALKRWPNCLHLTNCAAELVGLLQAPAAKTCTCGCRLRPAKLARVIKAREDQLQQGS